MSRVDAEVALSTLLVVGSGIEEVSTNISIVSMFSAIVIAFGRGEVSAFAPERFWCNVILEAPGALGREVLRSMKEIQQNYGLTSLHPKPAYHEMAKAYPQTLQTLLSMGRDKVSFGLGHA